MKIHSDILTRGDFITAARRAGVTIVDLSEHGSKTRLRAFKFYISGSGVFGGQYGNASHKTATWDEWGIALAHLFDVDPFTHTGKGGYVGAEDYHWQTGGRFKTLTADQQHLRHRWERMHVLSTGEHHEDWCDCGAVRRWSRKRITEILPSVAMAAAIYRKRAAGDSSGISDQAAAWAYEQMQHAVAS